jgi:predicted dinucleotide-binding enzyme
MKIGIIGSGNIGGTLTRLFTTAGHDVMVSNQVMSANEMREILRAS